MRNKYCGANPEQPSWKENSVEERKKNRILERAEAEALKGTLKDLKRAKKLYESIPGWKHADELAEICRRKIIQLEVKEIKKRQEMH